MSNFLIYFLILFTFVHRSILIVFPEWTGTFDVDDSCNQVECCCISEQATITKVHNRQLLVTANVAGAECQQQLNGSSSISALIPIPGEKNGFQITTKFLGSICRFTLSFDSQYIANVNLQYPTCSGMGRRIDDEKNTALSIFTSSVFISIFSLLFHRIFE